MICLLPFIFLHSSLVHSICSCVLYKPEEAPAWGTVTSVPPICLIRLICSHQNPEEENVGRTAFVGVGEEMDGRNMARCYATCS